MADCECLQGCIFFNDRMANKPATASIMKQQYCLSDNTGCARYQVFKAAGKEQVPPDLYPIQVERVKGILSSLQA